MSLYLDYPFTVSKDHPTAPKCFLGKRSAHLTADSEKELVAYATAVLGMKAKWLQKPGTLTFHFDVMGKKLEIALADKRVQKIGAKDMARIFMRRKDARDGKAI